MDCAAEVFEPLVESKVKLSKTQLPGGGAALLSPQGFGSRAY